MKKLLGLLAAVGMLCSPALAQKVTVDYAHEYDFSTVGTFKYIDTRETNPRDPLMAERIVAAIRREATEGGLTEVERRPDLFVTYHFVTRRGRAINTTRYGYGGYRRGWYGRGGHVGGSTTTVSNYVEGTLVIDAFEPVEKKLVWRGTGTVTLKRKPEKRTKQIDKILKKLAHRWEKILRKQGK